MRAVYWRRRIAALGVVAVGLAGAGVLAFGGPGGGDGDRSAASGATDREPAPQLPRGGRRVLPDHRVVAFYGAPQDDELGALGIGTPDAAARRLLRRAASYRRLGRKVLPAMELIAVIAASHPGADGMWRIRQDAATIRRYLRAARRHKALLILDIQPGRADFLQEARHLERWLREPDVSLALDPEWRVAEGQVPGKVIGTVDAAEVNAVSYWLDGIVREHDLPQKLLLVHRFTHDMISSQERLKQRPGLALAINVDGFGGRAIKVAKYHDLARTGPRGFHHGFKLFFREDTNLMRPAQVARLRPRPDVVVYE